MTADAEPSPPADAGPRRNLATIALLACAAAAIVCLLQSVLWPNAAWAAAPFPVLAVAATMLGLARTLPAQNVIAAAALIALMSGIAEIINVRFHIPFGARVYTNALGPQFFGVPWPVPFIWIAVILNSRGVARLILRPWRKISKYGLWVIALACILTVVCDFNLEPFASRANSWWIWQMPRSVPAWQTAPWVNFLGWMVVSLLILVFITPWLINKQRPRSSPPDYQPLFLWLLLNVLPAAGDAAHGLWLPAIVGLILAAAVNIFASRGARW